MNLLLVGLMVVVAGIVTFGALQVVDRAVEQVARADIEAEYHELVRYQSQYRIVGIADGIDYRISLGDSHPMIYMLVRADASVVVGNLDQWPVAVPPQPGWYRFTIDQAGGAELLAKVELIEGEFPVLVARRLSVYRSLRNEFLPFVLGSLALLAIIMLVVVIVSNRFFQRRIVDINAVLVEAGNGNLDARLPVSAAEHDDEISYLARQVNETLEENARLIVGLETVSQTAAHEINKELSYLRDAAEQCNQSELAASADELIKLLREILELSKIESSTDAFMKSVNLAEVVRSAVELYHDAFEEAQVSLEVIGEPVMVLGQSHLLINAVSNLLSNALRHAPAGSRVVVDVSSDGTSATVSVTDQGSGTTSDDLREVLNQARKGNVAGYGFGLRFVQAVALRHGAKLRLANLEPGFQVLLTFPVFNNETVAGKSS
ncbi:MAG: HAMP domain-containing histidine kinase [Pseudomonadaceae bacterium]|nr:HAMP domain-containing histidine kinase [Pseudomonadaceae bacterium]